MNQTHRHKAALVAVLAEFVVSAGIGIYFHWILHWEQGAYMVLAIGMLLTLVTYLVQEEVARSRDLVLERYENAHSLLATLSEIEDPECQGRAHRLLAATQRTLALLQSGHLPLDETEFYLEGARALNQSNHRVLAVDPLIVGWDTRGALRNYYQANLQALERGVRITRVFLIRRADLHEAAVQKVLQAQIASGITVRLAFLDELNVQAGGTNVSDDFAIYDDRVVTERIGAGAGHFGRKTQRPAEVARYLRIFDIIAHSAHPVAVKDGRVVPADPDSAADANDVLAAWCVTGMQT